MSRDDWPAVSYAASMMEDLRAKGKLRHLDELPKRPEEPPVSDEELAANRAATKLTAKQWWIINHRCDGTSPSPYATYQSERAAVDRLRRRRLLP